MGSIFKNHMKEVVKFSFLFTFITSISSREFQESLKKLYCAGLVFPLLASLAGIIQSQITKFPWGDGILHFQKRDIGCDKHPT